MYQYSIAVNSLTDNRHAIQNLELVDGCFGAPLQDMSGAQIEDVRGALINSLTRIVLYSTDLPVTEYNAYIRFFRNAHLLHVENVLLTYTAVAHADNAAIARIVKIAEAFSIRVLFRFEAAHIDEFNFARYGELRGPFTGIFYAPNEFTKLHIPAFREVLYKNKYKDDVVFLRIEDMLFDSHTPMMLEKGNTQIKECISVLLTRNYNGYFSFGAYGNFTAAEIIPAFCRALSNL